MRLDQGITSKHMKAAVEQLKHIRGLQTDLDLLVDRIPDRKVAHVCEEALYQAGGILHRPDLDRENVVTEAIRLVIRRID